LNNVVAADADFYSLVSK